MADRGDTEERIVEIEGSGTGRMRRQTVTAKIDHERGVFMISVAAELAEMHPQTLRMYEAKGLITPQRSPKNTRLYSQRDVERLRRIQRMTTEEGLNLAGVETVLALEQRVEKMRAELNRMRARTEELERQMESEVSRAHQTLRGELVPYGAYDVFSPAPSAASAEADDVSESPGPSRPIDSGGAARTVSIPVTRRR